MPATGAQPGSAARPRSFAEWCRYACQGSVVRRGLKFAVIVGAVLIAINHGDAIVSGRLTGTNYVKMAMTMVVPYVVSVLSSVGALAHSSSASGSEG